MNDCCFQLISPLSVQKKTVTICGADYHYIRSSRIIITAARFVHSAVLFFCLNNIWYNFVWGKRDDTTSMC